RARANVEGLPMTLTGHRCPGEDPGVAGSLGESDFHTATGILQSAGLLAEPPDFARFAPLEAEAP
ncbi:MAG TPA: hypothetical protein PLY96_05420, partial [Chromatiaceae bacterium]|nr:hypothetical protein [Chromatiaceae bacterium]